MVFGISGFELLIVIVFALIIFGPDKLPEVGRTIGRAIGTFKRAQEDMERVIRAEMYASSQRTAASAPASPQSEAPVTPPTPEDVSAAASIWAATDEDDEEDEE